MKDSFYIMNGDSYFTGNLKLDVDMSTVFVAKEPIANDVGYIKGKDGKVVEFVDKNPDAEGKQLVSIGMYKFYKNDLTIPMRLPLSMEYDILPKIDLSYRIIKTDRFDIGTPERLERFKQWFV